MEGACGSCQRSNAFLPVSLLETESVVRLIGVVASILRRGAAAQFQPVWKPLPTFIASAVTPLQGHEDQSSAEAPRFTARYQDVNQQSLAPDLGARLDF